SARSAFATASPDWSDTSRSADWPPSMTVMFNRSLTSSSWSAIPRARTISFAQYLHFGFQFDSSRSFGALFDGIDQVQDIVRRRVAFVDDEIAVHVGHDRAADTRAFQTEFVHQPARGNRTGILKDATRAGGRGLGAPAFPAERLHALFHGFA